MNSNTINFFADSQESNNHQLVDESSESDILFTDFLIPIKNELCPVPKTAIKQKKKVLPTNRERFESFFARKAERSKNTWKLKRSEINTKNFEVCSKISDYILSTPNRLPSGKRSDYWIKLFEDVAFATCNMVAADNNTQRTLAFLSFCKFRSGDDILLGCVLDFDYMELYTEIIEPIINGFTIAEPCAEGEKPDYYTIFNKMTTNLNEVRNSPIVRGIRKVLTCLLSFSVLSEIKEKVPKTLFKDMLCEVDTLQEKSSDLNIFITLYDSAVMILERIWQAIRLKSWTHLFHSRSSYETWMNDCVRAIDDSHNMGNPHAHNIDEHEFTDRIIRLVEQGKSIVEANKSLWKQDKYLHTSIMRYYSQILQVKSEYLTINAAQKERKCPLGVLIDGTSSVGKSTFAKLLFYHYGKVMNKAIDDHFRFVRNPADDFWSGYRSNMWCVHLDDVASHKPTMCPTGDQSVMELLQIVNQIPFNPNQASIDDKGRTPMRAEFVTASTNTHHLNIRDYYMVPLAAKRRLRYVFSIEPKAEYNTNGALDFDKIPVVDTEAYPDFWRIFVYIVKPTPQNKKGGEDGYYERFALFDGEDAIYHFMAWFSTIIKKHNAEQTSVMDSLHRMSCVEICDGCKNPMIKCMCGKKFLYCTNPKEISQVRATERVVFKHGDHLSSQIHDVHWTNAQEENDKISNDHDIVATASKPYIIYVNTCTYSDDGNSSVIEEFHADGYEVETIFDTPIWFEDNTLSFQPPFNYSKIREMYNSMRIKWHATKDRKSLIGSHAFRMAIDHLTHVIGVEMRRVRMKHKNQAPYIILSDFPVFTKKVTDYDCATFYLSSTLCNIMHCKEAKILFESILRAHREKDCVFDISDYELPIYVTHSYNDARMEKGELDVLALEFQNLDVIYHPHFWYRIGIWLDIRLAANVGSAYSNRIRPTLARFGLGNINQSLSIYYAKQYALYWAARTKARLGSDHRINKIRNQLIAFSAILLAAGVAASLGALIVYIFKNIRGEPKKEEPCSTVDQKIDDPIVATPLIDSTGLIPRIKSKCVTENVWYKDIFTLTPADLPQASLGAIKDLNKFQDILENNCRKVEIVDAAGTAILTNIFGIVNHTWALNKHAIGTFPIMVKILGRNHSDKGISETVEQIFYQQDAYQSENSDIVLIEISALPAVRSMMKFLLEREVRIALPGSIVVREKNYGLRVLKVKRTEFHPDLTVVALNNKQAMWRAFCEESTVKGDCGSPLLIMTAYGPFVAGILSATDFGRKQSLFCSIFSSDIKQYLKTKNIIPVDDNSVSTCFHKKTLSELHPRSSLRFAESGTIKTYGSLPFGKGGNKSSVVATVMQEAWISRGLQLRHTAPNFRTHVPWHGAVQDLANQTHHIPTFMVDMCKKSFVEHIKKQLPMMNLGNCHVYDLNTALNGAPGVKFVDSINKATSTGFPYNHTKKFHLFAEPSFEHMHGVRLTNDILLEIEYILALYKSGQRYKPVFTSSLKDEPLTFEKANIGKIRVFMGAPFAWSCVVRMYLLWFIQLLQGNKYAFCSAPGTNCWSREWGEFYKFLTKFGINKIIAGDYGRYDKHMIAQMISASFDVIIMLAQELNFSQEEIQVIRCIAEDVSYAIINLKGDIMEFMGGNPSGHPLTVIINCLANVIYLMLAYLTLNPANEVDSFFKNVHLLTYGDDNIMGVSDDAPWFNHTAVSEVLAQFGVVYTSADKTSEIVPYINISEASFLKRKWVWSDDLQAWMAQLERASIEKSLLITVKSKSISAEEQSAAICSSAHAEYFMYGKEEFLEKSKLIEKVMLETNLQEFYTSSWFPEWCALQARFERSSIGIEKSPCDYVTST